MRYQRCFVPRGFVHCRSLVVLVAAACAVMQIDRAGFSDESTQIAEVTQKRIYSGLQVGETTRPFTVLRVKGDETNELEIVTNADNSVTLICFLHQLGNDDRVLFGLGLVDFYATKHENLNSHFVLLSNERDKITTMLQNWNRGSLFKKSLVSLSIDGAEGPGYYGLNRDVAMTVLVVKGNQVVDNLVFNAPNYRDLESIMRAVAKALGKPEPTLANVQKELRAERQRQLDVRIKASPVFKLASNEQIGRIMFRMVNARGNRSKNAQRSSQQFLDWAGDSEERRLELRKYCLSVLKGDFQLDQYARAAIVKLAD